MPVSFGFGRGKEKRKFNGIHLEENEMKNNNKRSDQNLNKK